MQTKRSMERALVARGLVHLPTLRAALGLTERTMFRWISEGKIETVLEGGRRCATVESVRAFLRRDLDAFETAMTRLSEPDEIEASAALPRSTPSMPTMPARCTARG